MAQSKAEPRHTFTKVHRDSSKAFSWLALEPRIMFDGAAAITVDSVASAQPTEHPPDDASTSETGPIPAPTGEPQFSADDHALFDALAALDASTARQEIVFVSPSVRDYQHLLDGISTNVEVFVLDPARDGVEQMAEVLADRRGVDAVHIISHGAQAEVMLGSARLTLASMNSVYADQLTAIGHALSDHADLLIYGCNFGQGELGQLATSRLAELTGADVASSTDNTGHVALGGNWNLERRDGTIETALALTTSGTTQWRGLLAETILESYEPAFASMGDQAYEVKSTQAWGQTFTFDSPGATYTVNRLGLVLYRDPTAMPQVITVSLRSSWNGAVIASGQVSSASLGTSEAWVHLDLDTPATLSDNSPYYIRVDSSIPSGKVYVGVHDAGVYGSGDLINTSGTADAPKDMAFRLIQATGNLDPIILNLLGTNVPYTEGDGAVVLDPGLLVVVLDLDSPDFDTGALTVSFVAGSDAAEDVLAIRHQGAGAGQIGVVGNTVTFGGTAIGSFAGGSGGSNLVVTFNSNATAAAAQALMQNISYENTDTDNPTTGARTVRLVLTDGDGGTSGNQDMTVTVSAVNDAPTTNAVGASGAEDATSVAITLTGADVDGTVANFDLSSLPANGTLYTDVGLTTLAATGLDYAATSNALTLYFVPTADWNGVTTFQYVAKDNGGLADATPATATLTVTAVNDPPVNTVPGVQTVNEDTALVILGLSVTDVEGALSTVHVSVANGTVTVTLQGGATISAGVNGSADFTLSGSESDIVATLATLVYQGNQNYHGPETLTILSTDASSGADTDTVSITINPVNDAPVLSNNGGGATAIITKAENQSLVTSATSTDVDGGTPTYAIVGGADAALFTLDASTGALTFTSAPDFETPIDVGANNIYDITIQVADGNGGTDTQTLSIIVTDVSEGLPPSTPALPPVPPSLLPQPPATSPGAEGPAVGPSPVLPNLTVPLSSPQHPSDVPIAAVIPGPDPAVPAGIIPSSESAAVGPKDEPIPALATDLRRELRGFLEQKVTPFVYQTGDEVRRTFSGTALENTQVPLSEEFRRALSIVEDDLRRSTDSADRHSNLVIGVTNLGGMTLTAGFIAWLLRSGTLLASLAATMPAWRHFDPLPVALTTNRERRSRKATQAAAAKRDDMQFPGIKPLLDKPEDTENSHGGGRAT